MNSNINILVYSKNKKRNLEFGDTIDDTDNLIISLTDKDFKKKYIPLQFIIGAEIDDKLKPLFDERDKFELDEIKLNISNLIICFNNLSKGRMFYKIRCFIKVDMVDEINLSKPLLFEFYINLTTAIQKYESERSTVKTKVFERW